jgi:predicted small metal-binding protein/anti-sigma regulatory factor (Ser/Thr protein kinase)
LKRFACHDIISGCPHVFVGADDQAVLDRVIAHAADDHGLVKPPLALIELVMANTHIFVPTRSDRGHLRLLGGPPSDSATGPATASGGQLNPARRDDQEITAQANGPSSSEVMSFATDRLARGAKKVRATDSAMAGRRPNGHHGYRHECLLYRGTDDLLAGVVPFIRDGVRLHQAILVAITEPRQQALRDALGNDADQVVFADMAELGNPGRIIPALQRFAAASPSRPIRGVGEPIWADRRPLEIIESQFHEALMDVALGPNTPLWVLCPYDVDALDEDIIAEAHRSHASVVRSDASAASPAFGGPLHAKTVFSSGLSAPAQPTMTVRWNGSGADIAAELLRYATSVGLSAQRSARLVAAIDELATAGAQQSAGDVEVRLWLDGGDLVCEVGDRGVIDDPLVGRSSTVHAHPRERGIRLANDFCDLVQVRSGTFGTTVRVHSWL